MIRRLSLAEITGFTAFGSAMFLAFTDLRLAAVPLGAFVILCMTAPFLPWFSFFLPLITRGDRRKNAVALSFDDGPDPVSTRPLLNLLSKYGVKATFFVIGKKAETHPELIREIIHQGHAVGNHSHGHDNFLMLRDIETLKRDIHSAQNILKGFGIQALAFRPPVGVTNPRLGPVLSAAGMFAVNYRCRAGDFGNRRIGRLSQKILKTVRAGDIIMLHDIAPRGKHTPSRLLEEIERLVIGLENKGLAILPLSELIGMPVMANRGSDKGRQEKF